MTARLTAALLTLSVCVPPPLLGADTRDELVAEVTAALQTHDRVAFEKCVSFEGTDESVRKSFQTDFEDPIFSWAAPYVFATERHDRGPIHYTRGDKHYTENGDWTFLLDIYLSKPPSKGFVLLAGTTGGKCKILLPIQEHP